MTNAEIEYVAGLMGMKAHAEVVGVEPVDGGYRATTKDGQVSFVACEMLAVDGADESLERAEEEAELLVDPDLDVPEGTIPEVLDWVSKGDSAARAAAAWDRESDRPKPRSVLIAALEKLIED